jgi:ketosteroid isomerase-like protein
MSRTLILIVLLLGALAVQAETSEPPNPAQEAILGVLRAAEAGWNAGDIPTYMNSYWQSDQLRFASGGRVSFGWQPVRDGYLKRYPDKAAMGQLVFADLDVQMTGPDHAVVFGSWRLIRAKDNPHGLFTLIFRRLPEGWRIIHDHTSSAAE